MSRALAAAESQATEGDAKQKRDLAESLASLIVKIPQIIECPNEGCSDESEETLCATCKRGVEDHLQPVAITADVLDGFDWVNLLAINEAINNDLDPNAPPSLSQPLDI
jgi:hypothetical protein